MKNENQPFNPQQAINDLRDLKADLSRAVADDTPIAAQIDNDAFGSTSYLQHEQGFKAGDEAAQAYLESPAKNTMGADTDQKFRRRRVAVLTAPLVAGLLYAGLTATPKDTEVFDGKMENSTEQADSLASHSDK